MLNNIQRKKYIKQNCKSSNLNSYAYTMYMYLPVLLVLVLTLPLLSYWTDTAFAQVLTGISKLSHILSIVLSVDL